MPEPRDRNCPLCGSDRRKILRPFVDHHLAQCRACGMTYVSRRPTEADLSAYYANYPAVEHLSPVTEKRYNELLDRFEAYRQGGRLIDVGCGSGLFLQVAAKRGWEVHGTEYGERPIAACKAKGIHIIEGAMDPSNYPPGHFDVVCSFEVIEHLVEPGIELDRFKAILRPGGLLYVTTPNFNCLARRLRPREWNVVNYPEHLMYFTPRTIARMAEQHGFRTLWVTTTGISLARWMTGRRVADAHVKQQSKQRQEDLRARLESRPLLRVAKSMLNGALDLFKVGDSLKAGFQKPEDQ